MDEKGLKVWIKNKRRKTRKIPMQESKSSNGKEEWKITEKNSHFGFRTSIVPLLV
jgi:hypothetical protein